MLIALVVCDGVLDAECEAFRSVLGLARDADVISVGPIPATTPGRAANKHVDATFSDIEHADVVVVPGGLGCERAADDPDLRNFLQRMGHAARYVAASSTGSVVLASAGLLHGRPAATHWLASDLLRRYGSEADTRRLVVTGDVITAEGQISAVEAAFALVERIEGSDVVDRIRATLIERGQPLFHEPSGLRRLVTILRNVIGARENGGRPEVTPAPSKPPVTPRSVMVELVENDGDIRRLQQSARRRRTR